MVFSRWARPGDVNAFFGLSLDNLAGLVLLVGLLSQAFDFPASFAIRYMVPGTALGVLLGDLVFAGMGLRLARRTGRNDVTAMPLGLDTPSTFGMVFFVLGPAFLDARGRGMVPDAAAHHAWQIGMCTILASGIFKLLCALVSRRVQQLVPRAGLLGSLAAIALVLISFLPLVDIFSVPVVGLVSLGIVLMTLTAHLPLPGRVPGALGALLAGGLIYYGLEAAGWPLETAHAAIAPAKLLPGEWLTAWSFQWLAAWDEALHYLPVAIPFALATVVGGIDCTESAAAAGDEYHAGAIVGVEALATIVAACCGGVVQTTPYIGHPAYKAMGGRSAYTLATALFIGSAGVIGYFGYLYAWIPKAAIYPVLVFIGLEICAQSYHATPRKHYAAVAIACLPALAAVLLIYTDRLLGAMQTSVEQIADADTALAGNLLTLRLLSGGFIVTSLLWASALAALIDHRLFRAAACFAVAALCAAFGVIHSPLPGNRLLLPWAENLPELPLAQTPLMLAAGYAAVAAMLAAFAQWGGTQRR